MSIEDKLNEARAAGAQTASATKPSTDEGWGGAQPQRDPKPEPSPEPEPQRHPAPRVVDEPQDPGVDDGESRNPVAFNDTVVVSGAAKDLAEDGIRGWLNRTFGFCNFERTEAELERDGWKSDMNRKIHPMKVVGVVSGNGSTGKSSTTQVVGSTIARARNGDGVCAVDIDSSSILATRMRPVTSQPERQSVTTFARAIRNGEVKTSNSVDQFMLSNSTGFSVLPGANYTGHDKVNEEELYDTLDKLYDYKKLVFLDFPGSREVPVGETARHWLDAMILVVENNATSYKSAKHMLETMQHSHAELLQHTIVLFNDRSGGELRMDADEAMSTLEGLLPPSEVIDNRVFEVHNDAHIGESGVLELDKCDEDTQYLFQSISSALMRVLPLSGEPKFRKAPR